MDLLHLFFNAIEIFLTLLSTPDYFFELGPQTYLKWLLASFLVSATQLAGLGIVVKSFLEGTLASTTW